MSWNKEDLKKKYQRPVKFNYNAWFYDDYSDWYDYDIFEWHKELEDAEDSMGPRNMKELGQYRLLTLLRFLSVKSSTDVLHNTFGWYW